MPRMNLERLSDSGGLDDEDIDSGLMTAEFTLSIYFEPPSTEKMVDGERERTR